MKKRLHVNRLVWLVSLVLVNQSAWCQDAITKATRANNIMFRFTQMSGNMRVGDVIMAMPSTDVPEVIGDTYWDKHWGKSSILMAKNDELIEGYHTRYDIYKDEFEFLIQKEVKVLKGALVKNIVWLDSITGSTRYLISARDYKEEGVPLSGFIEVLVEGSTPLFKKVRLEILKPDFNPALNVGSKDARILKKESFYFAQGNELIKIKSKKSIEQLFGENKSIEEFIKKNNIKFTSEKDLLRLFLYFQSISG